MTQPIPNPPPRLRPPDDGWLQWIAENMLRDCSAESMLEQMMAAGLDPQRCEAAIAAMANNPAYRAAKNYQQLQRKFASVMANQQKLWETAADYGQVEKRSKVSRTEFLERYVRGCRPLVLTDIARDWPALKRWSPQDLKRASAISTSRFKPSATPIRSSSKTSCSTNRRFG